MYAESICKEILCPSTTQHSGGASYVNCHFLQLIFQKIQRKRQNTCPVWWNLNLGMILKFHIFRARKYSRGKQFPALLQVPFIPKNDDGDYHECEGTNVESDVQYHENNEVG